MSDQDCFTCDFGYPYYPDVGAVDVICQHDDNIYQNKCPLGAAAGGDDQ